MRSANLRLHRFATVTACATFCLIIAGALVTSNEAGLSVPDWPLSYGKLMPPMVGGIVYEHTHRMVAATIGLLTIVLALWLWKREERRWVRRLGWAALGVVITQGLLGGLTVLFYLPFAVSVAHACLAQAFFCIVVSLATFTSPRWFLEGAIPPSGMDEHSPSLRILAVATTLSVYVQLILGAAFRHSGLKIGPHLVGAGVVTLFVVWIGRRILTSHYDQLPLVRPLLALAGLLIAQLLLGLGAYAAKQVFAEEAQPTPLKVYVTTAHVAVGALVLASSVVLTLRVFKLSRSVRERVVLTPVSEKAV